MKNQAANPKIQYNYSNNNYIPELLTVNSCWNVVSLARPLFFLLHWVGKCKRKNIGLANETSWNGVNILASHKCGTSVMYHSLSL